MAGDSPTDREDAGTKLRERLRLATREVELKELLADAQRLSLEYEENLVERKMSKMFPHRLEDDKVSSSPSTTTSTTAPQKSLPSPSPLIDCTHSTSPRTRRTTESAANATVPSVTTQGSGFTPLRASHYLADIPRSTRSSVGHTYDSTARTPTTARLHPTHGLCAPTHDSSHTVSEFKADNIAARARTAYTNAIMSDLKQEQLHQQHHHQYSMLDFSQRRSLAQDMRWNPNVVEFVPHETQAPISIPSTYSPPCEREPYAGQKYCQDLRRRGQQVLERMAKLQSQENQALLHHGLAALVPPPSPSSTALSEGASGPTIASSTEGSLIGTPNALVNSTYTNFGLPGAQIPSGRQQSDPQTVLAKSVLNPDAPEFVVAGTPSTSIIRTLPGAAPPPAAHPSSVPSLSHPNVLSMQPVPRQSDAVAPSPLGWATRDINRHQADVNVMGDNNGPRDVMPAQSVAALRETDDVEVNKSELQVNFDFLESDNLWGSGKENGGDFAVEQSDKDESDDEILFGAQIFK